MGRVAREKGL